MPGATRGSYTGTMATQPPEGAEGPPATTLIPASADLALVRETSQGCRACHLWARGTQTVFGEGHEQMPLMLVGEQPGDAEDVAGKPFVGPAGRLLDTALEAAGIERNAAYVTNAVKHFKWEPRGKRRIHKSPDAREIEACRPWLDAELRLVQPRVLVLLGATAAQALLGRTFRVTKSRGQLYRDTDFAPVVMATVHPSSILRAEDEESRRFQMGAFIADLSKVAPLLTAT